MSNLTVIVVPIVIYIVATFIIGLKAHGVKESSAEDYFLCGRGVTWWHLGLTLFATWFSTFAFLGVPGFFYERGIKWFVACATYNIAAAFLAWFIGRKVWLVGKKRGHITPADMLVDFYKSERLRSIVAVVCILALIPYCLIQFVGIGKVVEASTSGEVPYWLGVMVLAVATAFYSVFGGVRAIIWTDALQGIVFLCVILIGGYVAYTFSGGLFEGFEKAVAAKPEVFQIQTSDISSIVTLTFIWSFGFLTLPHIWQRSFMGKSAQDFSKGIIVFLILAISLILATMVTGMLGMSILPGVEDSDKFVPLLFETYAPWALPIIVLATFAAGMSTIDSQLLSASSVVVRDLFNALSKDGLSQEKEEKLGKVIVTTLIFGLAFLALIPEAQGSVILLASKGTLISLLLLIPLLCSLYNFNVSGNACMTAILLGGGVLALFETKLVSSDLLPLGLGSIIYAVGLQIIVMGIAHKKAKRPV